METEFKVLTHCGTYVDVYLLEKGIYTALKPCVFDKDETIESLVAKSEEVNNTLGSYYTEKYIDNLKKCQLTSVLITKL